MDDRNEGGQYRGRGPSNYKRSDERIKEDVNDRLTDHPYIDASNIDVEAQGGEITLTGTVNSRHEKRIAEDVAENVSGVRNVENRVRVNNMYSAPGSDRSSEMGMSDKSSTPSSKAASRG